MTNSRYSTHPTHRAIVELLATRPRAVGELASELPVFQPAVSQHLKVLKDVGLPRTAMVATDRHQEHRRHQDRHGAGAESIRKGVDGDDVWSLGLGRFAEAVTA